LPSLGRYSEQWTKSPTCESRYYGALIGMNMWACKDGPHSWVGREDRAMQARQARARYSQVGRQGNVKRVGRKGKGYACRQGRTRQAERARYARSRIATQAGQSRTGRDR
jgi:hypothetical protein